jgi:hypothetical protein
MQSGICFFCFLFAYINSTGAFHYDNSVDVYSVL